MAQMHLSIKEKQTHRHREQTCGCQGGRGRWDGIWEYGFSRCKLLHLEWISSEVLLSITGNYIQALGMDHGEDNIRERMCIYLCVCVCVCVYYWVTLLYSTNWLNV